MSTENIDRADAKNRNHLAMEAKEMLKRVEEDFPDNPEAMRYFYDLLHTIFCEGKPLHEGDRLIGTMCIQVPEELIYAAGATPIRLCSGAYTFDQLGAELMPTKSCPLVKSTLGMLSSGSFPYLDSLSLVVNPTTCDQKKKAGEMLEDMGHKVYHLELPPTKDSEEAREYWQRSVKRFAHALKDVTGQKITKKGLKAALQKTGRAQEQYRRFYNLRKSARPMLFGKDAFVVTNAYFYDDVERWTEAVAKLNDELEARQEQGFSAAQRRAPRILFTGSPPIFPNLKLPILIEQAGGIIVADEVCSSNRMLYDTPVVDEWFLYDMIPALADRYLKPCTCPIFVPNTDRKRKLIDMAKAFAVDGIVYQTFAGCHLYDLEHRGIAAAMKEQGIPVLYVETDYSPDDMGQLSTRVEAFIESLKAVKRKK